MATILGVDPGTTVTGYGIIQVNGSSYQAKDYGCIRPPASNKLSSRYLIIYESIEQLILIHKPSAVVVETQYVQHNVQSTIKLGMARGIIILAAAKAGIPIFEYAPTKAKKAIVGKGRASKHQVQGMIQKLLCLPNDPMPEDASDALALALCHAQGMRFQQILDQQM
jgi:crossover junction endodeoxyribonuclease RuvC